MSKSTKFEISKKHILDTAINEFSEEGYHQTSIKDLAQKAGISQGLMYNYFNSKEKLLKAIFEIGISDVFKTLDIVESKGSKKEIFLNYLQSISIAVKGNEKIWKLIHSLRMQNDIKVMIMP